MNAEQVRDQIIIQGRDYFIDKFGSQFLRTIGAESMGANQTGSLKERLKEEIGFLLTHLSSLRDCIAASSYPQKIRVDVADALGFKKLMAVFGQENQPITFSRDEFLKRCQSKEQRFYAARNRPSSDPEKQMSDRGYAIYTLVGFRSSSPPGNGTLDASNRTFEFCLFKQVLEYLVVNRSKLEAAARHGHFVGGERDDLLQSGRQMGFGEDDVEALPELGLLLIQPREYVLDPVQNLHCESVNDGIVRLRWDLPSATSRCDGIILERRHTSRSDATWEQLARGDRITMRDDNRSRNRGESFTYRVRSVYRNSVAEDGPTIDVLVPDEPRNPTASWVPGKIELCWTPGLGSNQTLIYRRAGGSPQVVQQGRQPLDSRTVLIQTLQHTGSEPVCYDDSHIEAGIRYFYLLLSMYADGTPSKGVSVDVKVPAPPPPPNQVKAEYQFDAVEGKGHVRVEVFPAEPDASYTVVRVDPPLKTVIDLKLDELVWIDADCTVGKTYSYRVTPSRDRLEGLPATSNFVNILPGIANIKTEAGDRIIELRYQTNPAAREVIVRRGEKDFMPQNPQAGAAVPTSSVSVRDVGLINGNSYNYAIFCRYQLANGTDAWSARQEIRDLVPKLTALAVDLAVRIEDDHIVCTLGDPRAGHLLVLRMKERAPYNYKDQVALADIETLGRRIPVEGLRAVDLHPDPREPWYIVFTISDRGDYAIASQQRRLPLVPDVEELKCFIVEGGVRLKWKWPESCHEALVLKENGRFPDPTQLTYSGAWFYRNQPVRAVGKSLYEEYGDSYFLEVDPTSGEWYVLVVAIVGDARSAGAKDGCRCQVPAQSRIRLSYNIYKKNEQLSLEWRVMPAASQPFRFIVRGSTVTIPGNPDAGNRLFPPSGDPPWPEPDANGVRRWEIHSPYGSQTAWCRLFTDESEPQRDLIDVRHPDDVGNPVHELTVEGRRGKSNDNQQKGSRQRSILCPYCFEKFGWWQIYLGQEEMHREYRLALWRRFWAYINFRQGPPDDVLQDTIKLCPKHCKELRNRTNKWIPIDNWLFLQPSIHIGLMGTHSVGKTHWIFSTYRRLESFGLTVLDKQTKERCDQMLGRVINERTRLERTQRLTEGRIQPFLFRAGWNHGNHRQMVLALCDVSGDDWSEFDGAERLYYYLRNLNGLVFLVDPLQLPSMRLMLRNSGSLPEDAPSDKEYVDQKDPIVTLDNALRQHQTVDGKYELPLAVVVSKGDVLWQTDPLLRSALRDSPIYHPGGQNPGYDMALHWTVQFAVRDFMRTHGEGLVEKIENKFSKVAYFCVSPTGCGVKSNKFARFAPWRVEEPVLWLFSQLKLIPAI